jgi:hypothetical protein
MTLLRHKRQDTYTYASGTPARPHAHPHARTNAGFCSTRASVTHGWELPWHTRPLPSHTRFSTCHPGLSVPVPVPAGVTPCKTSLQHNAVLSASCFAGGRGGWDFAVSLAARVCSRLVDGWTDGLSPAHSHNRTHIHVYGWVDRQAGR